MFKLFILTICLILSPTLGLVKTLFETENHCYSGCQTNYPVDLSKSTACKNGCDFKLQNENCADQCKLLSIDGQIQASCIVGCSMNQPIGKSIILIRLRQRPLIQLPFSKNDPVETYNDMIKHLKEQSKSLEQYKPIAKMVKDIPLIKSFDEGKNHEFKQILIQEDDANHHLQQLIKFIHKQSKISSWILLGTLILCSAIISCMIISLCRNRPKRSDLSIRAEELIIEKEHLQPDSPVKIILTNH